MSLIWVKADEYRVGADDKIPPRHLTLVPSVTTAPEVGPRLHLRELREYGLRVDPIHPSPSGGDAPSTIQDHSCRSGDATGANPVEGSGIATRDNLLSDRENTSLTVSRKLRSPFGVQSTVGMVVGRCESGVAPSLAHGRVTL